MIISRFFMTVYLLDFVSAMFCGKRRKIQIIYIDVKFLSGGTKGINLVQFRGKISRFP